MGEGSTPAPTANSPQSGVSSTSISLPKDGRWPPRGWPMFACITRTSGTAACNERGNTHGTFLKYDLNLTDTGVYALEIVSGKIGREGTSHIPTIGIRFTAREDWYEDNISDAVIDAHVNGQNLIREKGTILRVILAMTYIVSRIDRGTAPNLGRVLKIYRLG